MSRTCQGHVFLMQNTHLTSFSGSISLSRVRYVEILKTSLWREHEYDMEQARANNAVTVSLAPLEAVKTFKGR